MDYPKAKPHQLHEPEVVLNLWAYTGAGGDILRVAGKAYVMQGEDKDKLALLRQLSATDFLSAPWRPIPKSFTISRGGEQMQGVANAYMLSDTNAHSAMFGPLMDELEKALPEQLRSYDGGYRPFRLGLPQSPLCVTTVVMEYEDGQLVPMVAGG